MTVTGPLDGSKFIAGSPVRLRATGALAVVDGFPTGYMSIEIGSLIDETYPLTLRLNEQAETITKLVRDVEPVQIMQDALPLAGEARFAQLHPGTLCFIQFPKGVGDLVKQADLPPGVTGHPIDLNCRTAYVCPVVSQERLDEMMRGGVCHLHVVGDLDPSIKEVIIGSSMFAPLENFIFTDEDDAAARRAALPANRATSSGGASSLDELLRLIEPERLGMSLDDAGKNAAERERQLAKVFAERANELRREHEKTKRFALKARAMLVDVLSEIEGETERAETQAVIDQCDRATERDDLTAKSVRAYELRSEAHALMAEVFDEPMSGMHGKTVGDVLAQVRDAVKKVGGKL